MRRELVTEALRWSETTYNVIAPENGVPVKAWIRGYRIRRATIRPFPSHAARARYRSAAMVGNNIQRDRAGERRTCQGLDQGVPNSSSHDSPISFPCGESSLPKRCDGRKQHTT